MAGKGGARPGAGRKKGVPNKSTADIKALIDQTGDMGDVIRGLFDIALNGEAEASRVAASNALLDRRFGKATQPLSGADGQTGALFFGWLPSDG